jgi:hypothetical protein
MWCFAAHIGRWQCARKGNDKVGPLFGQFQAFVPNASATHAYPLNYGAIERYGNAHKEMGHDANDAGRSVA